MNTVSLIRRWPARSRNLISRPIRSRSATLTGGPAEVTRRFNEAQLAFIARVSDAQQPWMQVSEHAGLEAAQTLAEALIKGDINPLGGTL